MLGKRMAAGLVAVLLAAGPAMAQAPAPGSSPQPGVAERSAGSPPSDPGAAGNQGRTVGAPKDPATSTDQSWGMAIPIGYLSLVGLGAAAALWFVLRRRSRRS